MQFFTALQDLATCKEETRQCTCEKHGSYEAQVLIFKDGTERASACPKCLEEEENKERKKAAEKEREKFRSYNIEPEYLDKSFDDYVPKTESQQKAKNAVMRMVEQKHGKVIILGSNGVGKTMLGSIAVKELGGKIYSMYEISTMIRQSYTVKAERSELEIVKELASVPMLVIDELGRTKGSETEQNWLSFILDKRHTRKLPFMLLSNGHFKKFCKDGGCPKCFENFVDNDILSRLREDSSIIVIEDAPDARKEKIAVGN